MFVAISPRDGCFGILEGQKVKVLDREKRPRGKLTATAYFSRFPDTALVEVNTSDEARKALERYETRSLSLDMLLLLFDHEVSNSTRKQLARELDSLFQDACNKDYVLDILLAKPMPETTDVNGAINAAKNFPVTDSILNTIINCQARVRSVYESWLLTSQETIVRQNDARHVFGIFCQLGVFRTLALEASDTSKLNRIQSQLMVNPDMEKQLDATPRIIQKLIENYRQKIPQSQPNARIPTKNETPSQDSVSDEETRREEPKQTTPHAAYSAALSQIDKIVELYIRKKDHQANSILHQLISEHAKYAKRDKLTVKTLTNIATKVGSAGRSDVSLDCLYNALDYPNGIDSLLYLHIGTHLRESGEFDKALECYKFATALDDGSLEDRIRINTIHVAVARGHYNDALSEYLAIPNLDIKPHALLRLGTLYRKMGRLHDSRLTYFECLGLDEKMHAAKAGLAEIRKQSGKPHDAIADYNRILSEADNLDEGAKRVYELSRSHLFRITKQYKKAEVILRDLVNRYPADRDVHLQLAKLFELQGIHSGAEEHFYKAMGKSFNNLRELIFSKASSVFKPDPIDDRIQDIPSLLKPDETGLKTCFDAYTLIKESEFEKARIRLDNQGSMVDRMTKDYAEVLRFHTMKKLTSQFTYKSEHSMSRVAKGAYKTLREAMQSIQEEDFTTAEQLETEFLQRIAA